MGTAAVNAVQPRKIRGPWPVSQYGVPKVKICDQPHGPTKAAWGSPNKLTKREATEIKQIIIKSGSPCIIKKTVRGVSYVYFEPDKYLIFETDREGYIRIKHNDKVVDYGNEKYNMQRKPKIHWRRINIFAPLFAKLRYIVFRSNYKKIYLVVDAKALEKYKVYTKRVKGMKLK